MTESKIINWKRFQFGAGLFFITAPLNLYFIIGILFQSLGYDFWDIGLVELHLITINFGITIIGIFFIVPELWVWVDSESQSFSKVNRK